MLCHRRMTVLSVRIALFFPVPRGRLDYAVQRMQCSACNACAILSGLGCRLPTRRCLCWDAACRAALHEDRPGTQQGLRQRHLLWGCPARAAWSEVAGPALVERRLRAPLCGRLVCHSARRMHLRHRGATRSFYSRANWLAVVDVRHCLSWRCCQCGCDRSSSQAAA